MLLAITMNRFVWLLCREICLASLLCQQTKKFGKHCTTCFPFSKHHRYSFYLPHFTTNRVFPTSPTRHTRLPSTLFPHAARFLSTTLIHLTHCSSHNFFYEPHPILLPITPNFSLCHLLPTRACLVSSFILC